MGELKAPSMRRMQARSIICAALCLFLALHAFGQDEKLTVHLVFSCHLDVGFTTLDSGVINGYFTEAFPRAIRLANWMRENGQGDRYIYTTHSWLVSLYMDCPPGMGFQCPDAAAKQSFTEAVTRGDITWHGFPFNSQYETYESSLVQFGIDMTHDLDRRFGLPLKKTISLRDVPGLTRGAVPIFAQRGIRAVTVGVNGGSAPPDVPHFTPFNWTDPASGTSIIAMWHPGGYGGWSGKAEVDGRRDCIKLEGFSHVLCVAWKGDNLGPPGSEQEVLYDFQYVRQQFPGATVRAAQLDDYTNELLAALPNIQLQEFRGEVGDTWVYGVQSDPLKVADFRAGQRYRAQCLKDSACPSSDTSFSNFSRLLMKPGEHTWGLDIKGYLRDFANYSNAPFHACLAARCENYLTVLHAWWRQAAYTEWGLQALGNNHWAAKMARVDMATRRLAAQHSDRRLEGAAGKLAVGAGVRHSFSSSSWELEIDGETGVFTKLRHRWPGAGQGTDWAAGQSAFGQLLYDLYNEDSFNVIWKEYMYNSPVIDLQVMDFGKFNLTTAVGHSKREQAAPKLLAVYNHSSEEHGLTVHLKLGFDEWLVKEAGAPVAAWVVLRSPPHTDALLVHLVWQNKTATRLPEAMWYKFQPAADAVDANSWRMNKLGSQVSPLEVVMNGSHSQHAVQDAGINVMSTNGWEKLHIRSLDVSLVSPGAPTAMPIARRVPDLSHGMSYNLVNNAWGTNYVMWVPRCDDDVSMTFRFAIEVEDVQQPSSGRVARRAMKPQHFFVPLTAGLETKPVPQ